MQEPSLSADDALHFTYGDYCQWDDGERWELIDGQAYAMSPAPGLRHQSLVGELFAQLHARLRDSKCEAFVAPFDVRLPRANEPDDEILDVVQPDLSVVCDPTKLDDRGCRGAPDFVIEVLSRSTIARDRVSKRDLYEHHGVREYWLVHPKERVLTTHRLGDDGRFGPPQTQPAQGRLSVAALPSVEIDWDLAFARRDS